MADLPYDFKPDTWSDSRWAAHLRYLALACSWRFDELIVAAERHELLARQAAERERQAEKRRICVSQDTGCGG